MKKKIINKHISDNREASFIPNKKAEEYEGERRKRCILGDKKQDKSDMFDTFQLIPILSTHIVSYYLCNVEFSVIHFEYNRQNPT